MKWLSFAAAIVLVGTIGCSGEKKESPGGAGGEKLKLTGPGNTSIEQGESKKISVSIKREKFEDPVDLKFEDLPKGVTIEESDLKFEKGATKKEFTLKADAKATPVEGKAKVSASGAGEKAGPAEFTVTVKEKK